ncbi:MAG: 4Fe-4S dicluster domain-containing protein [Myxococcota bacterium]
MSIPEASWLERSALQSLLDELEARGYETLGPVARDGAVSLEAVQRVEELPVGWRDEQQPGRYRLESVGGERVFDVVHGHGGLKPLVFAPRESLLQIETEGVGRRFTATPTLPEPKKLAVLGVRACDLAALRVQDRVFLHDRYPDPYYASRRKGLLLVAVHCTRSVSTCFCTSMGTGPEAREGFDLALTELDGGFVVRCGSEAGREILDALSHRPADAERLLEERRALDACASRMERRLETGDLPDLLYENLDHSRWDDVADRCLSCGNCTQVCPTCFCHDERDEPALDGGGSIRVREWDSCFSRDHAQVHGFNFRPQVRHRYRQWLVHKLASWIDQFGSSGCVGCGRCITWCPTGIDLTEEVAAIRGGGS